MFINMRLQDGQQYNAKKIIIQFYIYIQMKQKQKEKEKKQQSQSNILVAIRVRPLNQKEANSGDWDIIRTQDNLIIILDPVEKQFQMENKKMLDVLHRSKQQRYAFDKIYRNQTSQKIYNQTAKSLIKTVITGKNATVFAYGPTGTGKTYTMLGNQDVYGLNVLAIRDIFNLIQQDNEYDYTINITYVQIYNQMIRDLLVATSNYLQLRDDNKKGVTISGVTEFKAQSTQQVMNLLLIGNKRRTTQATNANQTSSRSHAVFQINVIKTPRTKNTTLQTLTGKLSLIDLAGSERGTVTENRGIRLMEGAKINRSLLALANCINALGDKNKKGFFVPYRDSKLTRLLKDSLGGNCKTVMIANISPASSQFQQTINTLKYANRAKNIKTKALTNKKLVSIHISEYKNIINDLRQQIEQLKTKLQKNGGSDIVQNQYLSEQNSGLTENQACTCGKVEENYEIKKVKEQIFQNFNERIQLRRALMQIQQQNAINIIEIKKRKGQITALRKNQLDQQSPQYQKVSQQLKSLSKTIHTLKLSTQKNLLKKQIIHLQLTESMAYTKKLREQIPKRVKSKQNRQFLQIIIKNHVLQLQNIQLQINLQIQEKIIGDLKTISDAQRKGIEGVGIGLGMAGGDGLGSDGDGVGDPEGDIQLEIEEDDDNQAGQGDIGVVEEDQYREDFEDEDIQNQKTNNVKNIKNQNQNVNKSMNINRISENKQILQQQDRKNKPKPLTLDQNSNNVQLGIIGINNIKKRQKTVADTRIPPINPNSNPNISNLNSNSNSNTNKNIVATGLSAPKEHTSSADNLLDFNLKGVNLKLNQKLPFQMAPKEKKKR